MSNVKFAKGTKTKCQAANVPGTLYFTTDTKEVLLDGNSYGGGVEQGNFNGSAKISGKITLDLSSGDNVEIAMPAATTTASGLMSASDKNDVGEMQKVLYEQFAKVTLSASSTIIEKGVFTPVSISGNFKFNNEPALAEMQLTSGSNTLKTESNVNKLSYMDNLSDSRSYTITAQKAYGAGNTVTKTATVNVNAYYPKFVGGNVKSTLDEADVIALTKQGINGNTSGTYNVTSTDNQYFWICVPSTFANVAKVTLGGFAVPMAAAQNVTVTGKGTYKCYRSANPLSAGTRSFVVA